MYKIVLLIGILLASCSPYKERKNNHQIINEGLFNSLIVGRTNSYEVLALTGKPNYIHKWQPDERIWYYDFNLFNKNNPGLDLRKDELSGKILVILTFDKLSKVLTDKIYRKY